jgi:hypothetical protein
MKYLLQLLFISLYLSAACQKLIIYDSVTLKKGIYKNFDEFKFNCPSIPFNYELTSNTKYEGTFQTGDPLIVYTINLSKKKEKG